MIAIFQLFGTSRLSSLARPRSPTPATPIGIGAFNLIRADVYRAIGGFESLRMEVVEDVRLGVEVKRAGYRQRVAFGPGLIRLRWAEGTRHSSATSPRISSPSSLPYPARRSPPAPRSPSSASDPRRARRPALFPHPCSAALPHALLALPLLRRYNGIPAAYFLTFPIAAASPHLRSFPFRLVTLVRGGIRWRGTFYPLSELRKNAGPLIAAKSALQAPLRLTLDHHLRAI